MKFNGQGLTETISRPMPAPNFGPLSGNHNGSGTVTLFTIDFSGINMDDRWPLWAVTVASRQAFTIDVQVDNTESGAEEWLTIENVLDENGTTDTYGNVNYSYSRLLPVIGFRKFRVNITHTVAGTVYWAVAPLWRY